MLSARDELRHLADTLTEFQAALVLDLIQQRWPEWCAEEAEEEPAQ